MKHFLLFFILFLVGCSAQSVVYQPNPVTFLANTTINNTILVPNGNWNTTSTNTYLDKTPNNVGIGTTTPLNKLEVIGTANASVIRAGSYLSSNGTTGFTGTCTLLSITAISVKNGLITGCT